LNENATTAVTMRCWNVSDLYERIVPKRRFEIFRGCSSELRTDDPAGEYASGNHADDQHGGPPGDPFPKHRDSLA
jgi:hypothetical protein